MRRTTALVLAVVGLAACSDTPPSPLAPAPNLARAAGAGAVRVTTSADAGPGSFRAAILAANADPAVGTVVFDRGLAPLALQSTVTYTGVQPLEIVGNGARLDGAPLGAGAGAFESVGGADLTIRALTVARAPGVGVRVQLPSAATGIVTVSLDDVRAVENGLHGVLINDQSGYLDDPESTSPAGSAAGLRVRVTGSRFADNGFGAIDQDGLRINEGGAGELDAVIARTEVTGNGGDGVELDERGDGSATFVVQHTRLADNGGFSAADYDDGIDVDEGGAGDVDGRFVHVAASDNFEQGVDLNENDAGDLRVAMTQVEASGNGEEGVEFEEDDDFAGGGDLVAELRGVTTLRNGANDGDAGLKLREKGAGDVRARVVNAVSSDNLIAGILVREDAAGTLAAAVVNATTDGNVGDGIAFDENGAGALDARVQRARSSDNGGAGVAAEQAAPGTGRLRIAQLTARGNADGPVAADATVTVEQVP